MHGDLVQADLCVAGGRFVNSLNSTFEFIGLLGICIAMGFFVYGLWRKKSVPGGSALLAYYALC